MLYEKTVGQFGTQGMNYCRGLSHNMSGNRLGIMFQYEECSGSLGGAWTCLFWKQFWWENHSWILIFQI
jgi:hypothetical protein